jgi:hypothetical protein
MTDKRGTEKELEGSGHGSIGLLSWNFPGGCRGKQQKSLVRIGGVSAKIRTEHLPNTNLDRYSITDLHCGKLMMQQKRWHTWEEM